MAEDQQKADTAGEAPDRIFEPVSADQQVTEIESYCMNCGENGLTRLLLTVIPHFREVVLMAFECPHCGFKNNEIQSATAVAEKGMRQTCRIQAKKDLSRQVVKSESATVRFEELDFEIPPATQRGVLTTVEGLITKAVEGLSLEQPARKLIDENVYNKIESVIATLNSYAEASEPFTFTIDDPAGNSYVENLCAPAADPQLSIKHYKRTAQQNEELGLQPEPEESGLGEDDLAFKEEIHTFGGVCSSCHAACETKMHMLDIPHFKEVIIWATNCDSCGYRSNEVKAGGAISEKGKRITLRMTDTEDLSRDILKSETCGLSVPEAELELTAGTLGGRFTTVEGLLRQIHDELEARAPFQAGDSATSEEKVRFSKFLDKLDEVIQMKNPPYTLILDDPLANSYLQNIYAPDEDPNMTIEMYERTWEQNEFLGLNDVVLEDYETKEGHDDKGEKAQES
ncbi:nucleolar zinc-finger protein [Borealophlyctis nickersoniae]|nr:nucleolar zinc-finger protein [Borealophlyctis nickersoniae]